jgi:hypothetical protein
MGSPLLHGQPWRFDRSRVESQEAALSYILTGSRKNHRPRSGGKRPPGARRRDLILNMPPAVFMALHGENLQAGKLAGKRYFSNHCSPSTRGLTGKEVAHAVKQLRPDIRILYMSGYTDDVIEHHGGLGPEIFFLQKPFTSASLAEKVRQSLA